MVINSHLQCPQSRLRDTPTLISWRSCWSLWKLLSIHYWVGYHRNFSLWIHHCSLSARSWNFSLRIITSHQVHLLSDTQTLTNPQCDHTFIFSLAVRLTHWGRDEMNNILQTTFLNVFSSMKMFEFRLKFHWSLFPRVQLTIFQHWFR